MGRNAGYSNTTGSSNVAIGQDAMGTTSTSHTANHNVCVGRRAGYNITTGNENTCLGQYAASYVNPLTTGTYNIYLGSYCYGSAGDVNNEYVIGYNFSGQGSNTFRVKASSGAYQSNNSQNWSTTSDRRIKKNIVDNTTGLDIINQITVRNFEYKTEDEIKNDNPELTGVITSVTVEKEGQQLGVIAQEIENVLPEVVETQTTGIKTVNSDNLTWYLVNAVKELSAKNEALEARITALEGS
tara:strand:- start:26 stop:748 length:723 start_codon:yes stop_codon:yes gene_type:complete